MSVRKLAIAAAAVLGLTAGAAQAQQQFTDAQKQQVKTEAAAAVEQYYAHFRAHNMKALPGGSFTTPWIIIGGQGPRAFSTDAESLANFEASLKDLISRDWGKSEYTVENVCALNPNAAIVSGYNTRYKKDGSVMSVGGTTYILGKAADGWKITSYTGHTRGHPVKCD
ncbi:hypothetical protein [Phenylobacterium sp.]|jgi:hypothetical protein|uniref:DUF6841 family protein n=1 Tax=Phenylobacterium sp. TaxID=1871053 RepID=UPI003784D9FC